MSDNRFGISLLSKEKFNTAYDEEVMIDKNTGEILVKSSSGEVISYNYNSRLNSHISETKLIANNLGVYGDIVSIEFDDTYAPFTMEFDKNYVPTPITIMYIKCKKLLFNLDLDPITMENNIISHNRNNIIIELSFSLYYTDATTSEPLTISCPINELNSNLFILNDNSSIVVESGKRIAGIQLNSFIVKNIIADNSGNIVPHSSIIRPIFNSLFAVIEV